MALIFDSSVLSPFARAGKLGVLDLLTSGHRRVVTNAVLDELDRGCDSYPSLRGVRALPWLETVQVDSLEELVVFSGYVRVLGSGSRNIGESSVLAWAEIAPGIAMLDDNTAVNAARARGVAVRRTLALLCDGLSRKVLSIHEARALVDALASDGGARFPCDGAGFEEWAETNGLLAAG